MRNEDQNKQIEEIKETNKLVLYKVCGRYCMTTEENYNRRIMDSTKVMRFSDGFTKEQALSYITNYGLATKKELIDRTGE